MHQAPTQDSNDMTLETGSWMQRISSRLDMRLQLLLIATTASATTAGLVV